VPRETDVLDLTALLHRYRCSGYPLRQTVPGGYQSRRDWSAALIPVLPFLCPGSAREKRLLCFRALTESNQQTPLYPVARQISLDTRIFPSVGSGGIFVLTIDASFCAKEMG